MLYTIHYSGKSSMQNIIFLPLGAKNVKLIARLGIFRHYCVFMLEFFKQAVTKVCLKLLCNCHFICGMARKHTRIAVEKVFVTRKLSKAVTTLTVAKVSLT